MRKTNKFLQLNQDDFIKDCLNKITIKSLAKKYNVSDKVILKWKKILNIPYYPLLEQNLSERQIEIIEGSLLGDGSLRAISSSYVNSYYSESHCANQLGWLEWKYNELKYFFNSGVKPTVKNQYRMNSRTHEDLTKLELKWYKRDSYGEYILLENNRIKIIPKDFHLTPLKLAIWYYDDGCLKKYGASLATDCFKKDEVDYLICELRRMGLNHITSYKSNKTRKDGQDRYTINILSLSIELFLTIIKTTLPNVPDCLKYKLDYNPIKKSNQAKSNCNIPNFHFRNNFYIGKVIIMGEKVCLGRYLNKDTAIEMSKKVNELKRSNVCDINKFKALKKDSNRKLKPVNFPGLENCILEKNIYLENSTRGWMLCARIQNIKKDIKKRRTLSLTNKEYNLKIYEELKLFLISFPKNAESEKKVVFKNVKLNYKRFLDY